MKRQNFCMLFVAGFFLQFFVYTDACFASYRVHVDIDSVVDKGLPVAFFQLPDDKYYINHMLVTVVEDTAYPIIGDILPGNILVFSTDFVPPDGTLYLLSQDLHPQYKSYLSENNIIVDYDWSPYLVRVENDAIDAFILKDFSSYPTVLHETGFNINGRKQYVYGWWSAATMRLHGEMRSLAGIDFESVSVDSPAAQYNGNIVQSLKLTAAAVESPEANIDSEYTFFKGVPGVRVTRTYRCEGDEQACWGPDGYWLGGQSSWFPTHQLSLPDSHYTAGNWYANPPQPNTRLTSENDLPLVILYWESSGLWLALFLDPDSIKGAFSNLEFAFAFNDRGAPGWRESVENPFTYGELSAWYIMGQGSKADAEKDALAWYASLNDPTPVTLERIDSDHLFETWNTLDSADGDISEVTETANDEQVGIIPVYLENNYFRIGWDATLGKIIELLYDPNGSKQYTQDFLASEQAAIYFTAGSQWQRSLDWKDTDSRYLQIRPGTPVLDNQVLTIPDTVWLDPETEVPWLTGTIQISLAETEPTITFSTTFQAAYEDPLPYLGWHLDFPLESYRWVKAAGWLQDVHRWSRYRMGILDLQPMRPVASTESMMLYADPPGSGYGLSVHFDDSNDTPMQACNLPNPLFDMELGIQKFGMTATQTYWRFHNTRGMEHQPGTPHTIAIRLTPLHPGTYEEPDFNTVRVHLPHAPELEAHLDHFWIHHCHGGPGSIHGVAAWWWSLGSRFSPKMALSTWRDAIMELLAHTSDGRTVEVDGWIVPKGAIPTRPHDFNWNNGYLFDNNGQFLKAVEEYYLMSGDRAFLESNKDALEEVCHFYLNMLNEEDGVVLPDRFDGIAQNRAALFWDGTQIGYKSAHVQLYAITSCRVLARLLHEINRPEDAEKYEAWAERLRDNMMTTFWRQNDLHDNQGHHIPGGRYAGWITADQYLIDPGYSDLNLMAAYLGEVPDGGTDAILEWIDSDSHSYAWRDSITGEPVGVIVQNTIDGNSLAVYANNVGPRRAYSGPFNPFSTPAGMQNGQVMYFVAGFDWVVRARNDDGARAVQKLTQFIQRYSRGDLTSGHGVPESRPLPMFQGSSQMSPEDIPCGSDQALAEDSTIFGLGILSGIFGLETTYEGLTVQPYLTEQLADAEIHNLRYRDISFNIKFLGYGDKVISIDVNGVTQPDTHIIFPFKDIIALTPANSIEVVVRLNNFSE